MQFLAYADIHHDCYTNGITLEDTIYIEDQITEYAVNNNIKYVIFAGDWYRATNPLRSVIAAAEFAWKRRSDAGITTIAIPGNHDRSTRAIDSDHAFVSAYIFRNDLKNVIIIDKIESRNIDGINFLFIPAGHENIIQTQVTPHVIVFHGMIIGSKLSNNIGIKHGVKAEILSSIGAQLVLGGDNHTPQIIEDIYNARYLGAPIQHGWADKDQIRGFWHINIDNAVNTAFIPSVSPRFIKLNIPGTTEVEVLCKLSEIIMNLNNNSGIIDVTLVGKNAKNINQDIIRNNLCTYTNIRQLRIITDNTIDKIEISPGINNINQPEDKWSTYISSFDIKTDGLEPSILNEIGRQVISEARKDI